MKIGHYLFLDYGEVEVYFVKPMGCDGYSVSLTYEDEKGITWQTTIDDFTDNLKEDFKPLPD